MGEADDLVDVRHDVHGDSQDHHESDDGEDRDGRGAGAMPVARVWALWLHGSTVLHPGCTMAARTVRRTCEGVARACPFWGGGWGCGRFGAMPLLDWRS